MFYYLAHDNQGGQWLIRRAEFHVGYHVNSMFRLKCKVNDPNLDKRSNLADKRQVTYCSKKILIIIVVYFVWPMILSRKYSLFNKYCNLVNLL